MSRVGLLLMDRAAFFLPADVLSIYLQLSLAKRRLNSSSARLFQQTGMAHLLAISGLPTALIKR
jgi:predicted membrane metal-binding protein